MKKLILIVFIFSLFITHYSYPQIGWSLQNGVTSNALTCVYLVNQSTGYLTGFNGIILKTTNFGNNWDIQNSGVTTVLFSSMFLNAQTGYCFGGVSPEAYILKTTNGGQNWFQNYYSSSIGSIGKGLFLTENIGIAISLSGKVLKTTNAGLNWNIIYSTYQGASLRQCFFIDQSTGWSVGIGGIIYKTSDGGYNWISQNGNTSNDLFGLFFTSATSGFTVGVNGTILKTTNGGQNWIAKTGITSQWLNCVHFINSNTGWIIGGDLSNSQSLILRTDNGGDNWTEQISPTNNRLTSILCLNSNHGIAVGVNGAILRTTTGGSSFVSKISGEIPKYYCLSQNYPNPFNPSTNIRYQVKNAGIVKISVYDMLGKEIETLVNEKQSPGTYEVSWNGSAFPSGTYFYKITAGDFSEIRKMVLIK